MYRRAIDFNETLAGFAMSNGCGSLELARLSAMKYFLLAECLYCFGHGCCEVKLVGGDVC
jgi:hypothetical protein